MEIETTQVDTATPADGTEQPVVDQVSAGKEAKQEETSETAAAKPPEKEQVAKKAEEEKEKVRAARLAQQLEREKKFRNERLAWEKERDTARKQMEEERASFKAQVEKLQATRTTLDKFVKELRENPIQVLQEYFGIGPEQYYHRVMNNGKPDPNELTSRELAELKRQLAEEKEWRANQEKTAKEREEAAKKAEEERKQRETEQKREADKVAARKRFFDFVNQDKSKYSDLLIYPENVVLDQAERLVNHILEKEGEEAVAQLTFEDLANRLNEGIAAWHAKVKGANAPAAKVETATAETPAAPVTEDTEVEAAVAKKTEAKKLEKIRRGNVRTATTLSGEMSTRTTAKTKTNDYEEAKKRLIRELEA